MTVPSLITPNISSVTLDCHYQLDEVSMKIKETGLIVKWYLNGVNMIYQWIPPNPPQAHGVLRGKLQGSSEDPYNKHVSLTLVKPTANLSGNYTCHIATWLEEAQQTKPMVVHGKFKFKGGMHG